MSDASIERIEISGQHGPATAAAVTAVIAEILHEEAVLAAMPVRRPRPSAWAGATRQRDMQIPTPSESFELVQWHHHNGESSTGDRASG
jgi:hypothetical protein